MRVELAPAFVLHTRPYRNTSLLVDVFTADYGRVSLVAKGASRPRSPLAEIRQLFTPVALSWVGQSALKTLTDVQPRGQSCWLTGTPLMSGLYVNELLIKLMDDEDAHPDLFDHYGDVIQQLAAGAPPAVVLRLFEKKLITEMGFGLGIEQGQVIIQPQEQYCFDPDCGIRLAAAEEPRGVVSVSGRTLLALQSECLEGADLLREARVFLGAVIGYCLGGVTLQSPLIWRQTCR